MRVHLPVFLCLGTRHSSLSSQVAEAGWLPPGNQAWRACPKATTILLGALCCCHVSQVADGRLDFFARRSICTTLRVWAVT